MNVLVITYWSYKEPLIQAAALPYLKMMRAALGAEGSIHLVTLEKPNLKLRPEEEAEAKSILQEQGITLQTRTYHKFGLRAMLAWGGNLLWILRYCKQHEIDILHAFGSPAATSAHVIHRLTKLPYVVDSFEPHAESMVENGSWTKQSIAYKLLWYFEKKLARKAAAVLGTTEGMKTYSAQKYGSIPANFKVRPACVSYTAFNPNNAYNLQRSDLGLSTEDIVCVYAGKLGGIYLNEEIFDLMKVAESTWGARFKFLLLSDVPEEHAMRLAEASGFPKNQLIVRFVPHQSVAAHLSLADFAINPVKPVPSKRYCTSIKDGEYWAMGLPVIIPKGISDDSDIIAEYGIGVVLEGLNHQAYQHAIDEIDRLLTEDRSSLQTRIRAATLPHRSIEIAQKCYQELYGMEGALRLQVKNFLVLIYNSFKDPLFQNLVYEYIRYQSAHHSNYRFELITFEQKKYALSPLEQENLKAQLTGEGIFWHPLIYHSGSFMFLKKMLDFSAAFIQLLRINFKRKPRMIISFANTSGAISWVLTRFIGAKLMVYSYEPHSEFLAEFGVWKRSGWRYKLLKGLERKTAETAEYILTGTKHMQRVLEPIASGKVFRAPSSVDEGVFTFNSQERARLRTELGIENRKVLIYAGKFGGIYYNEEIFAFCAELKRLDPQWFFVFLSPSDHNEVKKTIKDYALDSADYLLREAKSPEEVVAWLSASDAGLTAIPPFPSQKFRSPVKVGEYLLCGLPYITCEGVSEDDTVAREHNVGVVIASLDKKEVQHTHDALDLYFQEDSDTLRARCRAAGISYRGRQQVDDLFTSILKEA